MAEENTKEKKNKLLVGVIAVVVVAIGTVVALLLLNRGRDINDDFFKSDDTKYVLSLDQGMNGAEKTHTVLYYDSDDKITKWETYYEYSDTESAATAYDYWKEHISEENIKDYVLSGKYIIAELSENVFKDSSAKAYKEWFDYLTGGDQETESEESAPEEAASEETESEE